MQAAFPDLKFDVQQVTVNGNQATVQVQLSGTNTGTLSMLLPGMPGSIPPTGKKVSVPDTFVVTVQGDKVSHMQVVSPADGGLPAMLAQMGVNMPGM
jgi:predicted ester cyclase